MNDRRRFVIGDRLGRGGFGEVYAAHLLQPGGLETRVAVKILHDDVRPGTDPVRRLRDEGRLLARLAHPTILRVLDLTVLDGRIALVTEYVDGADLSDCIAADPPLSVRGALQVVGRIAGALGVAHGAVGPDGRPLGLVHRDIKPTNLRVGRHGEVKLLDFGIAYSHDAAREARTDSDLVVGSLQYMAPERFVSREADPAWDVFGLGAVLYEALAHRRFLPDGLRPAARIAASRGRYDAHLAERLDDLVVDVPVEVADLLGELLAFRPSDRPTATATERRCESIAEQAPGLALRRWCRAFDWKITPPESGPLSGRTLTAGTLGLPRDEATVESESAPPAAPTPPQRHEPETLPPDPPTDADDATDETTFVPAPAPSPPSRRGDDAPTEDQPAWAEPPTVELEPTDAPDPAPGLTGSTWAYLAGSVLLAFAGVLFAVAFLMFGILCVGVPSS